MWNPGALKTHDAPVAGPRPVNTIEKTFRSLLLIIRNRTLQVAYGG